MKKYLGQARMSWVSFPKRIFKNIFNLVKLSRMDMHMVWLKNNFFKWFWSILSNFKFCDLGIRINCIFENQNFFMILCLSASNFEINHAKT